MELADFPTIGQGADFTQYLQNFSVVFVELMVDSSLFEYLAMVHVLKALIESWRRDAGKLDSPIWSDPLVKQLRKMAACLPKVMFWYNFD